MDPDSVLIVLSVLTLVSASLAAFFAWRTYRLKEGIEIRGSFSVMSSIASEDRYVHEVILENLKDRAVVIFQILLEVSSGYYIQLEEFEEDPLVLRPFEAMRREYGPIDFYVVNMVRIRLDSLLKDQQVRKRLVLATSHGRYNVRKDIEHWHPIGDFFRNLTTVIARPRRSTYDGKAYGSGAKYIVRFISENRAPEIVPIYQGDFRIKKFKGFQLNADSLSSKEALETFLLEQAVAGNLNCSDFEVFDLAEWRAEAYEDEGKEEFTAERRSWFSYAVVGRTLTWIRNLRLRRRNKRTRKLREKRRSELADG